MDVVVGGGGVYETEEGSTTSERGISKGIYVEEVKK